MDVVCIDCGDVDTWLVVGMGLLLWSAVLAVTWAEAQYAAYDAAYRDMRKRLDGGSDD